MAFNHFPMRTSRALVASDPLLFGRAAPAFDNGWSLSKDLQLFAATFAAGFLFVSILIA